MPDDATGQSIPVEDWEDYLEEGETLLWTGGLVPDPRLRWSQIGLAIFGMPFLAAGTGLIGVAVWSVLSGQVDRLWQAGALFLLVCFANPFAAAGAALVAGPHLKARLDLKARMAHRYVRYALGTRRLYIATRWWSRALETCPVLPDARVDLIRDGLGTVILHVGTERDRQGDGVTVTARIEGLADGRPLYRLIRQLQAGMSAPR